MGNSEVGVGMEFGMGLVWVSDYVALYRWSGGVEVFGSLETKTLCSRMSVIFSHYLYT